MVGLNKVRCLPMAVWLVNEAMHAAWEGCCLRVISVYCVVEEGTLSYYMGLLLAGLSCGELLLLGRGGALLAWGHYGGPKGRTFYLLLIVVHNYIWIYVCATNDIGSRDTVVVLRHASMILWGLRWRRHLWLWMWRHLVIDIVGRRRCLWALAYRLDINWLIHILVVRVLSLIVSLLMLNSCG